MASIDWNEYKEFKKHTSEEDKLKIAIDFVKSYYNMTNANDIYKMISKDDIGQMLLERKDITSSEGLESFMFQQ